MPYDLSQGLGALGSGLDSLTTGIGQFQKSRSLAALGEAVSNNDYPAAMKAAASLGDPNAIMTLAKLGQADKSQKAFNKGIAGLQIGQDSPAFATASPALTAKAIPYTSSDAKTGNAADAIHRSRPQ